MGARVELREPVASGTKIYLLVHFRAPDGQVTTIRFEGSIERVREHAPFEILIAFRGTGRFMPGPAPRRAVAEECDAPGGANLTEV